MSYRDIYADPEKKRQMSHYMHFAYFVLPEAVAGMPHFSNAPREDAGEQLEASLQV